MKKGSIKVNACVLLGVLLLYLIFIFMLDEQRAVVSAEKERVAELCNERGFEGFYRDGINKFMCFNLDDGERVNITRIYWWEIEKQ